MSKDKTVHDVEEFWENNPLFTGETAYKIGSKEYFEEHKTVVVKDCFAGKIDPRIFPDEKHLDAVLDLGCGPGFWTIELSQHGAKVTAADLTQQAVDLTQQRAQLFGVQIKTSQENAEDMTFKDEQFSHVNCQGVIHHTPNTKACVQEIHRVLKPDGTALISVYYKNLFLRTWPVMRYAGKALSSVGAKLSGRGRENIYGINDINEIVRLYDGDENPIGKSYTKQEFIELLSPEFEIENIFFHFFPARTLPFPVPTPVHRFLDRKAGFMIFAKCKKKS